MLNWCKECTSTKAGPTKACSRDSCTTIISTGIHYHGNGIAELSFASKTMSHPNNA